MPAALQATGPRKPTSLGSGEKSPSNRRSCAASLPAPLGRRIGSSLLLTDTSGSSPHVVMRMRGTLPEFPRRNSSAVLPAERYDWAVGQVNDTPPPHRTGLKS